jgi:hypothetical protein
MLSTIMLRQLWTVVEETQAMVLLRLSDTDLVRQILGQLQGRSPLTSEEANSLETYICSRTHLIRDIAQARLAKA